MIWTGHHGDLNLNDNSPILPSFKTISFDELFTCQVRLVWHVLRRCWQNIALVHFSKFTQASKTNKHTHTLTCPETKKHITRFSIYLYVSISIVLKFMFFPNTKLWVSSSKSSRVRPSLLNVLVSDRLRLAFFFVLTSMLRIFFSPAPECVDADWCNRFFVDPLAATGTR